MNTDIKKQIFEKILSYDTIIISRHKRPDGDAVGSTLGLYRILTASFPEKRVFLDNEDYSEYVAFLGDEGPHPSDEDYENALVFVIDSGTIDRYEAHAWIVENRSYGFSGFEQKAKALKVSIDQVEAAIGLDLYPNLLRLIGAAAAEAVEAGR